MQFFRKTINKLLEILERKRWHNVKKKNDKYIWTMFSKEKYFDLIMILLS